MWWFVFALCHRLISQEQQQEEQQEQEQGPEKVPDGHGRFFESWPWPTTSPRDFAGYIRFYILKFNIKIKNQRQKSKELHLS